MNKQEHYNILQEELRNRDAYWQSELEKLKLEHAKQLAEAKSSLANSPIGQLANAIRAIVKDEIANATASIESEISKNIGTMIEQHLHVDVDSKWVPYSGQSEHYHKVTIDWY